MRRANAMILSMMMLLSVPMSAQQVDVQHIIEPLLDPQFDRAMFDVVIRRVSDRWNYWANTTIRLQSVDLEPTGGYNPAIHQIQFDPNYSDLNLVPYTPGAMNGYFVDVAVASGDIVINVIGPDSVFDAHQTLTPDSIRIGRVVITSTDGSFVPEELAIAQPYDYYQASAFKIDHDSVTGDGATRNVWFVKHDNPPLVVEHIALPPPPDICDAVFNFYGDYVGDLTVELGFTVDDEHCYEGYIIERALVDRGNPGVLTFEGRQQLTYLNEPGLLSCICLEPQTKGLFADGVEYRREQYAYRLIGKRLPNYGDTLEIIDTIFIRIPNAIISNARLLENPFKDETRVRFNIDDRLMLTAVVYDLGGRLIDYLETEEGEKINEKEYALGEDYQLIFKAPDIASQGLYNITLIGVPINDKSVAGMSRVIMKGQLLR